MGGGASLAPPGMMMEAKLRPGSNYSQRSNASRQGSRQRRKERDNEVRQSRSQVSAENMMITPPNGVQIVQPPPEGNFLGGSQEIDSSDLIEAQ